MCKFHKGEQQIPLQLEWTLPRFMAFCFLEKLQIYRQIQNGAIRKKENLTQTTQHKDDKKQFPSAVNLSWKENVNV